MSQSTEKIGSDKDALLAVTMPFHEADSYVKEGKKNHTK